MCLHIEKDVDTFSVACPCFLCIRVVFRENVLPFLTIFIITLAYNKDKKVIDSLLELIIM